MGRLNPLLSPLFCPCRPQHHRPSTFMPCDVHIEREEGGAVTVWCSEHEPMQRMKASRPGLLGSPVHIYQPATPCH